jgi:hypothetical protein
VGTSGKPKKILILMRELISLKFFVLLIIVFCTQSCTEEIEIVDYESTLNVSFAEQICSNQTDQSLQTLIKIDRFYSYIFDEPLNRINSKLDTINLPNITTWEDGYNYLNDKFGVPINVSQEFFALTKSEIENCNLSVLYSIYGEENLKTCLIASYYKAGDLRWPPCSFMDTVDTVVEMVAGVLSWGAGPVFGVIGTIKGVSKFASYVNDCG